MKTQSLLSTTPLVLITGANGWLGKNLVRALRLGIPKRNLDPINTKIRCLVPPWESSAFFKNFDVETVSGDITNISDLKNFFSSAEDACVFHLAGIIHPKFGTKDFINTNVFGTKNLLDTALSSNVKKVVVLSSNSPFGYSKNPNHTFDESSPYNPYMTYGMSKYKMEKVIQDFSSSHKKPEIVTIRAPWFYGPFQPERQTLFFSMIKDGKFPIFGNGLNKRSMSYVESLALGLILAMEKANAGESFWIADERPYSMNEIVQTVQTVLEEDFNFKVKKSLVRLPSFVSDLARYTDGFLQSCGLYHQKIHVLSEMNQTIACNISKAKNVLGFEPLVELREGMQKSIAWCLENKMKI